MRLVVENRTSVACEPTVAVPNQLSAVDLCLLASASISRPKPSEAVEMQEKARLD
jgi:hypothetical protein